MAQRFQVGWMRLIPLLGYHHVLMVFLVMGIAASSIMLAGCTSSNSLRNVYLLSISYLNTTTPFTKPESSQVNPNISAAFESLTGTNNGTSLEVRAGYLGLCLGEDVGGWLCSSSATALAKLLEAESGDANRNLAGGGDPLNLIWIASNFRNDIVFDGLIFTAIPLAFITLLLLATFPGWHEEEDETGSEREVKPFPSRAVSMIALGIIGLASILMFVSIFWQHVASSAAATMVHSLSYGTVKAHVGPAAMILGWVTVLLYLLCFIGLLILILAIRVLSETFT